MNERYFSYFNKLMKFRNKTGSDCGLCGNSTQDEFNSVHI